MSRELENKPLDFAMIRKVFEWIETEVANGTKEQPTGAWFQGDWRTTAYALGPIVTTYGIDYERCGTSYCFAGHVAEIHPEIQWAYPEIDAHQVFYKGEEWSVEYAVADALGLDDDEALSIFYCPTDLEQMREKLESLFEAHGEKL